MGLYNDVCNYSEIKTIINRLDKAVKVNILHVHSLIFVQYKTNYLQGFYQRSSLLK